MPMRFQKLKVYHEAMELCRTATAVADALPAEHRNHAEILLSQSSFVVIKIARGTAEVTRGEAYGTFRRVDRAAELCESILERLQLAGVGSPEDLCSGLDLVRRVRTRLAQILSRIRENQKPRDIFRD